MKCKEKHKKKHNCITTKANNNSPIRVIYKKANQPPEVKIIDNVFKLKKAIVTKKLDIIPYEELFIICNNKKLGNTMTSNIILPFYSICGDLILVNIDKKERKFKSLSQEDVIWYSQDFINKSPNSQKNNKKPSSRKFAEFDERGFENNKYNTSNNFEKDLIAVLVNIELVLASLLKGDVKK